jgi:hypothetical protein
VVSAVPSPLSSGGPGTGSSRSAAPTPTSPPSARPPHSYPRLPDTIDVLVLAAACFDQRRIVTAEGFEQTFAIYVLSRYLLAERLRLALERAKTPIILDLTGAGGIRAGRIHWADLQLSRGYSMFKATMQGA